MRSITNAGLCVLLAIFYNFASYRLAEKQPVHIAGTVDRKFEKIRRIFEYAVF